MKITLNDTNIHNYQWGIIVDLETNGEIHGHLIFDKDGRIVEKKRELSLQMVLT